MKRELLSMTLAFTAMVGFAQNVGDAIYFYRNDGDFNAFIRTDIDSITYSNYDIDSVYYDDIMTQVIYTADSIYRIPLVAVDSVSFVNPQVIFQPDVIQMDATMLSYLKEVNELALSFSSDMPESLRPQKGKVLFCKIGGSNMFDDGFAGRVINTNESAGVFKVECEPINGIEDIFIRLIGIERIGESQAKTRGLFVGDGKKDIEKRHEVSETVDVSVKISEQDEASLSGSVEGEWYAETSYFFDIWSLKAFISIDIHHDWVYSLGMGYKFEGSMEWPKEEDQKKWTKTFISVPFGYIFKLEGTFMPFWKMEGNAELKYNYKSPKHTFLTSIKYNNFDKDKEGKTLGFDGTGTKDKTVKSDVNPSSFDTEVSFNGTLKTGIKFGLNVGTLNIFGAQLQAKTDLDLGIKVEGDVNVKASTDDPVNFYNTFKDSKMELGPFADVEIYGEADIWDEHPIKATVFKYPFLFPWFSWEGYLLPEFKDLKVNTNASNKSATISVKPKRDLLFSLPVGIGIYDAEDNLVDKKYESTYYEREDQNMTISQTFSSLSTDMTYIARPLVDLLFRIPATPTEEFKIEKTPDDTPTYTGNPDEPTPGKMVDLGLSVKWAGWNIGSDSPEVKGDYYAWGETFTKSEYTSENYTLIDDERLGWEDDETSFGGVTRKHPTCWIGDQTDDGRDISGTEYDAAHVIWGEDWRMPSKTEAEELCANCTQKKIKYKGVDGILFTGPNGNKIFLPIDYQNAWAYWTSTFAPWKPHSAYSLYFRHSKYYVDKKGNVKGGQLIRAVSGKKKEKEICAYFEAPATWDNTIHCWAWSDSPEENFTGGTWPGVPCELVGTAENGNNIWKWTWDGKKQNGTTATQPEMIIFNNNGQPQTVDMEFKQDGYYNDYGIIDKTPSEPLYPDCCTYDEGEVCAFFEAPDTWEGTIHCWAWTDTDNFTGGNWPGVSCELVGTANNGNKIWKWTWNGWKEHGTDATQPSMIIFNNNPQPQTQDMPFTLYGYYTIDGYQGVIPKK